MQFLIEEMKEIITNEFIRYKDGFIDGKWELIEAFQLGKIIDLNKYLCYYMDDKVA